MRAGYCAEDRGCAFKSATQKIYCAPLRNTYRSMNKTLSTQISGLISLRRPVKSFRKVNDRSPRLRPVAMLNVSGVAISVKNAGTESV